MYATIYIADTKSDCISYLSKFNAGCVAATKKFH